MMYSLRISVRTFLGCILTNLVVLCSLHVISIMLLVVRRMSRVGLIMHRPRNIGLSVVPVGKQEPPKIKAEMFQCPFLSDLLDAVKEFCTVEDTSNLEDVRTFWGTAALTYLVDSLTDCNDDLEPKAVLTLNLYGYWILVGHRDKATALTKKAKCSQNGVAKAIAQKKASKPAASASSGSKKSAQKVSSDAATNAAHALFE